MIRVLKLFYHTKVGTLLSRVLIHIITSVIKRFGAQKTAIFGGLKLESQLCSLFVEILSFTLY